MFYFAIRTYSSTRIQIHLEHSISSKFQTRYQVRIFSNSPLKNVGSVSFQELCGKQTTSLFRRCRPGSFLCDLYRNTTLSGSTWRIEIVRKFLDFGSLDRQKIKKFLFGKLILFVPQELCQNDKPQWNTSEYRAALKSIITLVLTLPLQNLAQPQQLNICRMAPQWFTLWFKTELQFIGRSHNAQFIVLTSDTETKNANKCLKICYRSLRPFGYSEWFGRDFAFPPATLACGGTGGGPGR